jgi:predicted ATPase
MDRPRSGRPSVPRIEYLRVQNYRALRNLEIKKVTPLTALLGPNGSGKSTVFDVFAFLSECFTSGLRRAWDKRGRFKELRTRGSDGAIVVELKYRESTDMPVITYHLAIDEHSRQGPYVAEEWLQWKRGSRGRPFRFLDFQNGSGRVTTGDQPDEQDERIPETLESAELLAVNTLGQFAKHPRVSALRRFITDWHLSYLTADSTRGIPEAGPQERLSATGDNLPNVIQYLREQHSEELDRILGTLSQRVPRLEKVQVDILADGRLLLQIKDAPNPSQLIGIEEPENHLHPRLLYGLAEECRKAADASQVLVTTHSPYFVDALCPDELWVLYRDNHGYTQATRASDMQGVGQFVANGATLGHLWMEGYFEVGDPLTNAGGPEAPARASTQPE